MLSHDMSKTFSYKCSDWNKHTPCTIVALNKTLMLKTLHRPGAYYHNDYTITEHTF